jgi:hypothetical protein
LLSILYLFSFLVLSFSRIQLRAPTHRTKDSAFPPDSPSLRSIRFQGAQNVKKKRQLFRGLSRTSLHSYVLPRRCRYWYSNLKLFPFQLRRCTRHHCNGVTIRETTANFSRHNRPPIRFDRSLSSAFDCLVDV